MSMRSASIRRVSPLGVHDQCAPVVKACRPAHQADVLIAFENRLIFSVTQFLNKPLSLGDMFCKIDRWPMSFNALKRMRCRLPHHLRGPYHHFGRQAAAVKARASQHAGIDESDLGVLFRGMQRPGECGGTAANNCNLHIIP